MEVDYIIYAIIIPYNYPKTYAIYSITIPESLWLWLTDSTNIIKQTDVICMFIIPSIIYRVINIPRFKIYTFKLEKLLFTEF
jgi:hypothetical protein